MHYVRKEVNKQNKGRKGEDTEKRIQKEKKAMSNNSNNHTPSSEGFRMPAEWEHHVGCWMAWPERLDNYKLGAKPAQKDWAAVANAIAQFEPVTVLVSYAEFDNARAQLDANVRVVEMSYDDAWLRDIGPTWVVNDATGEVRGVDWVFNSWGGVYNKFDKDDQVAKKIIEIEKQKRYRAPLVLEGGSIHVDGEGTLITTGECLLNPNRNPSLTKDQIENYLKLYTGVSKVIWLPRGLEADVDTNGHVDNICCFLKPGHVALAWSDDPTDLQHAISTEAYSILTNATDAKGRKLQVLKIHTPKNDFRRKEDLEGLQFIPGETAEERLEGERLAGSYINFYIANGGVIVPALGDPVRDVEAREVLQNFYGDEKRVVSVSSRNVLLGGGNIHCITQQQPSGAKRS
eukprot:TRINITY_DN1373_c0_g1_i4.p1 TRINITY_DN1373_c0_g1~~TRINITY_DN1373_c0_g1_i4.p1  ORF type:complete len:402 (-),score=88.30 TRINITY_DN1373_c0_g1_i4:88-1293(-)